MAIRRSIEDILADYADALVAGRPPDIAADFTALSAEDQRELLPLLATVHALKGAYQQIPNPRPEFLRRLEDFVSGLARGRGAARPDPADARRERTSRAAQYEHEPGRGLAYKAEFLISEDFDSLIQQAVRALRQKHSSLTLVRFVVAPRNHYRVYQVRLSRAHREIRVAFGLDYKTREAPFLSAYAYYKHSEDRDWNDNRIHDLYNSISVPPGIEKAFQSDEYVSGIQLKMQADDLRQLSTRTSDTEALERLIRFFSLCCQAIEEGIQQMRW